MKVIRWEYKLIEQKSKSLDKVALTSRLNILGRSGWEYVTTTTWCNALNPTSINVSYWVFKRPIGFSDIGTLDNLD